MAINLNCEEAEKPALPSLTGCFLTGRGYVIPGHSVHPTAPGLEFPRNCPKAPRRMGAREVSQRPRQKCCSHLKRFTHLRNEAIPLPTRISGLGLHQAHRAPEGSCESVPPLSKEDSVHLSDFCCFHSIPPVHPTISHRGSVRMQGMRQDEQTLH